MAVQEVEAAKEVKAVEREGGMVEGSEEEREAAKETEGGGEGELDSEVANKVDAGVAKEEVVELEALVDLETVAVAEEELETEVVVPGAKLVVAAEKAMAVGKEVGVEKDSGGDVGVEETKEMSV